MRKNSESIKLLLSSNRTINSIRSKKYVCLFSSVKSRTKYRNKNVVLQFNTYGIIKRDLLVGFKVHFRVINYKVAQFLSARRRFTALPSSNEEILWKVLKRDDSCIPILQKKTKKQSCM